MDHFKKPSSADLRKWCQPFRPPETGSDSCFVSFEGVEGAGKSTQISSFAKFLEGEGYRVLVLREPGGTPFGEKLREAILGQKTPLHPLAEAHLFASGRAQLLHEKILPELKIPKTIILLDRFIDSSLVYQGLCRGLGMKTILDLHSHPPLCHLPHLTFFLTISLPTSLQRMNARKGMAADYFESSPHDFFEKLISGFDFVAGLFPERIHSLSAEDSTEEVFQRILTAWRRFQSERQR